MNVFAEAEKEIKELIDPEEVINIDFDGLEESSKKEAEDVISVLSRFYYDEEFMKSQPTLKRRIDKDLESLRINIKMRKADELAHDILLKNIGQNSSNASLYAALTKLQSTMLSITTKIEETITRLSNMLKNYQQEINFEVPNQQEPDQESTNTFRGSKAFIENMNEEIENEESEEEI